MHLVLSLAALNLPDEHVSHRASLDADPTAYP